jgi:hypothetical protein
MSRELDRLLAKMQPVPWSGCWLWLSATNGKYPHMSVGNKWIYAHRLSYELHKGPIPDGLQIDHLCRVPLCINPDHLEAVSQSVNVLRSAAPAAARARRWSKTHCPKGHPYDGVNTIWRLRESYWVRYCRACKLIWKQRRRAALRSAFTQTSS